jgi:hypothetical protein
VYTGETGEATGGGEIMSKTISSFHAVSPLPAPPAATTFSGTYWCVFVKGRSEPVSMHLYRSTANYNLNIQPEPDAYEIRTVTITGQEVSQ